MRKFELLIYLYLYAAVLLFTALFISPAINGWIVLIVGSCLASLLFLSLTYDLEKKRIT